MSTFNRPGSLPAADSSNLPNPFIALPNLANLRDVGGLPSTTRSASNAAQIVRSKLLYRAADLTNVPLEGLSKLHNELRVRTIFDFRSGPEIANAGGTGEWESRIAQFNSAHGGNDPAVTRHWTPIFRSEDYSPEKVALRYRHYGHQDVATGFVRAYEAILEHGAPVFGQIIRHMASANADVDGTLVHCTAGKDRTGVFVAVVLDVLGVPHEAIAAEYNLTEMGLGQRRQMMIARLASTGAFGEGDEALAAAERMTGAKKEAMLATLRFIAQTYGSSETYVKSKCEVSDEVLAALRKRFLSERERGSTLGQAVL